MPGFEFYRSILGILCVFFGFMAGRSAAMVHKHQQKVSRLYAWILRTTVCAAVVIFRHPIDQTALSVWALALIAGGLAYRTVLRQKPPEDLTHEIFPE